jgi:hypothetical protein
MRFVLLTMLVACSSDNNVHHLPDAPCTPVDPTIDVVAPTSYACHDPFKTKVTLTNSTCEPLVVSDVKLTAMITNGPCAPATAGMYPGQTVGVGLSNTVLDLTTGPFCCTPGACPTPFQCDETFTVTVDTPLGPLVKTETAHLSLDGCPEICP